MRDHESCAEKDYDNQRQAHDEEEYEEKNVHDHTGAFEFCIDAGLILARFLS